MNPQLKRRTMAQLIISLTSQHSQRCLDQLGQLSIHTLLLMTCSKMLLNQDLILNLQTKMILILMMLPHQCKSLKQLIQNQNSLKKIKLVASSLTSLLITHQCITPSPLLQLLHQFLKPLNLKLQSR
jgi:hypothetical protein